MTAYIIRRLLILPLILFGVTLLIFSMLQVLGPVERSALYVRDIPKTDHQVDAIITRYGLDKPFYVQYWNWLVGTVDGNTGERVGGVLRGDLGYSRSGREPVIAFGIWLGVKAALNHNKLFDQVARVFAIIGWSFPTFVFALLLLLVFYARLDWFQPGQLSTGFSQEVIKPGFTQYTRMMTVDSLLNLRFDIFIDALRHLIMPVTTLMVVEVALLLKITRSAMLEEMRQDYVTTARAKGLPEKMITNRHIRRNALIPVITVAGLTLAGLMGGVVITETVFNYPGIGSWAAAAAVSLDVLSMLGYALFSAVLLVAANLIVDIMYAVLDPRVRLS